MNAKDEDDLIGVPRPVFALNVHARYACAHSGACCTSGWPIPVERETYGRLRELIEARRLDVAGAEARRPREADDVLIEQSNAPAETPAVAAVDCDGACAFYERDRRRCAIHRQVGPELLPLACQQFPRVSLLDPRGLFFSLSHYCPTAANALIDSEPPRVVESPPAFPTTFNYDPLDARAALPPLLHPTVLLDLPIFDAWEREAVVLLGHAGETPRQALGAVAVLTESLRIWKPGAQEAQQAFEGAARQARSAQIIAIDDVDEMCRRQTADYELALSAVPESVRAEGLCTSQPWGVPGLKPRPTPHARRERASAAYTIGSWGGFAMPVRRYLASKLFGSWMAYQGRGLRTIVFSVRVALSLLEAYAADECERRQRELNRDAFLAAIRRTEELLVHLAGRQALADVLSGIEDATAQQTFAAIGCTRALT